MLGEFSKKCFQAEFVYLESRILTFAAEVEVDDFDRECFYRENFLKTFFLGWRKKNFFYTRHKFGRWDFPLEAIKLFKIFFEVETRVKLELDQILIRYNQPTLSSLLPGKQPEFNSWRKRMNCWQLLNLYVHEAVVHGNEDCGTRTPDIGIRN